MGLMLIYGVVNMAYTLATGTPIYKPLNYHDVMSFVWMIVLAGLEGGGYYGFYHLTNWKLRKVHQQDIEKHSILTVYNVEGTNSGTPNKVNEGKPATAHITIAEDSIEAERQDKKVAYD
jgi:hypothetical protein